MLFYLFLSVIFIFLQNDKFFLYLVIAREVKKCERNRIQIRDITVFESLSQVDAVCFDKTGVLTTRQMEVKTVYYADGSEVSVDTQGMVSSLVKTACALCNDVLFFEKLDQANAIDKALISFAQKNGINVKELLSQSKRIYDKPFDSENRYMASGYNLKDFGMCYFVKGDPDVILKMCDFSLMRSSSERKRIDLNPWLFHQDRSNSINQRGNISIALAYTSDITNTSSQKYTFLCLLELENSLQHGARETIREITKKGIRSIMLTGDRVETATNIGKKCGITESSDVYLTGKVIDRMALDDVARQSDHCSVFARLLPSQKGLIIRLFQRKNHHVVMIGDGPNDAVALKVADVGISFIRNSSPIAIRLSKILINELSDLLQLLESTLKIKRADRFIKIVRVFILAAILFSLYLQAVSYLVS